jgi:5-methylcytosine-specific restriction endonuclease McrA
VTRYRDPAVRLARAARERASAGWSWENDARKRLAMIRLVLATKGRTCHLCGLPGATTADHVVPRSLGGQHTLENLEPAHAGCNMVRNDAPLDEYRRRHPIHLPALAPSRAWT